MKRKPNAPVQTDAAAGGDASRYATIEARSDKLTLDNRKHFKEYPELLGEFACLRVAVEHLLGKAYLVDRECFIALGLYGLDFRGTHTAQLDWVKRDHELIVSLAASLRILEANALSDRPKKLSKLGVSTHAFSALRAIAAIQKLEATLVLTTSEGTVSHFPLVDPDHLAAARGGDDEEVPVSGAITGVDSTREGRLLLRVDHGSWMHATKGTLPELCAWLAEGKSIHGKARLKDGLLTIADFDFLTTQQQPPLPYGRRSQPRPVGAAASTACE